MPPRRIDGRWHVDTWVDVPGQGRKRIRKLSPIQTKKAAEEYERELVSDALSTSSDSSPTIPTFGAFAVQWLTTYVPANNRVSTANASEQIVRNHLLEPFGGLRLDEIGPQEIESYKAKKLQTHSRQSVKNHLTCLRKILATAAEWGLLQKVPKVNKPKVERADFDWLTEEERARLLAAAEHIWAPRLLVALQTGMRISELLALQWVDLDFARRTINVRNGLSEGRVGPTKGGRVRRVPMTAAVFHALNTTPRRGRFVFSPPGGRLYTRDEWQAPIWRACKRAGLRRISWHVLRHTFASHLVSKGVNLKVVQELLGHSSITVTERYAHLAPGALEAAIGLLEQLERQPLGSELAEEASENAIDSENDSGETEAGSARQAGAAPGFQNRIRKQRKSQRSRRVRRPRRGGKPSRSGPNDSEGLRGGATPAGQQLGSASVPGGTKKPHGRAGKRITRLTDDGSPGTVGQRGPRRGGT